ncbi:hypothetical protein [Erwinia amylovora]
MCIRDRLWRAAEAQLRGDDASGPVSEERLVEGGACLLYTSRCV